MTKGLPLVHLFDAPRAKGLYWGTHVTQLDNGTVQVSIEVRQGQETQPLLLTFSRAAYEDFRYVVADRGMRDSLWEQHVRHEQHKATRRVRQREAYQRDRRKAG